MRPFPNIPQTIGLLALVYAIQIGLLIPIGLAAFVTNKMKILEHPLALAFFNTASISIVLFAGLRLTKASFREVFPVAPVRLFLFIPMTLTIIGMAILLSEIDNLLRTVLPIPASLATKVQRILGNPETLFSSIFTLVVVAAVTEEFLFRGLILRGFLQNYSDRKAIIVSALLFGVFHILPWQIFGAFVFGAIFAWWFLKTRSLLPCLFGHALNNALPSIVMAIPQLKSSGLVSDGTGPVKFQPLWLDGLGLLLAAAGLWWTAREFPANQMQFTAASAAIASTEISPNGGAQQENLNAI